MNWTENAVEILLTKFMQQLFLPCINMAFIMFTESVTGLEFFKKATNHLHISNSNQPLHLSNSTNFALTPFFFWLGEIFYLIDCSTYLRYDAHSNTGSADLDTR